MRLHNTLTHQVEEFNPINEQMVRIYSCGPTVYEHAHIGNLSAYIFADTLHRVLEFNNYDVHHVMNYTDVDDKTIKRSQTIDKPPLEALRQLTDKYIDLFLNDMALIGNDAAVLDFQRATDHINDMQALITRLYNGGFAYLADDGVYFSIEAYQKAGKTYGQLLKITADNTSNQRIQNDEYDKASVHDFALWKKSKPSEPAWSFKIGDASIDGRPGWHIECSAMSETSLEIPFDIHTGGVDLIFPHHENEIAQSTALLSQPTMAKWFIHNEHVLIEGKKMAKSASNFYTLQDVISKKFDPMAFRLLILQAHYRSQVHFSWELLKASQNRLTSFRQWADLRFQTFKSAELAKFYEQSFKEIDEQLSDDLKTPTALAIINRMIDSVEELGIDTESITKAIKLIDSLFGLKLGQNDDINEKQKEVIIKRQTARETQDWLIADKLRKELLEEGVVVRDTAQGTVWSRVYS
ncbi:MAG TPA: cysteine--tRNA ligase [Candidatus Saccharimonadales bacterium]|nr:cysteine--tRNA ligase [Candidatus Saccharimonadales bacterium]